MAGSPLILPGGNNAAQYFNGTSTASSVPLTLSSWNQISISVWVWWSAFANNDKLAMEYSNNFNSNIGAWLWDPNSSRAGWEFSWHTSGYSISVATRPAAGQWHHVLMLIDGTATGASAVPAVYIDGVAQTLSRPVVTATAASLGNFTLYLMSRAGSSLFGTGAMAQLALFAGSLLGADDAVALAGGADPRSVSTGATHFWRMDRIGPEPNLGRLGAAAGTMTTDVVGMLALPAQLRPTTPAPWSLARAPVGTSLTADCSAPIGLSATARRPTASQQEAIGRTATAATLQLGSTGSAARDARLVLEALTRSRSDKGAAIETAAELYSGVSATTESRLGLRLGTVASLESSGSIFVPRDTSPPIEVLAGWTARAGSPSEALPSLSLDILPGIETTSSQAGLHRTPVEWMGAALVAADFFGSIEFTAVARNGSMLPSEWLTNGSFVVLNESRLPLEWLALLPAQIIPLHRLVRSTGRKRVLRHAVRIRLVAKT